MTDFNVSEDNPSYCSDDNVLFDKAKSKLIAYIAGRQNSSYIVPDSVKSIERDAFRGADNLVNLDISNGVEEIETGSFYSCKNLTDIHIGDSLYSINQPLFGDGYKLNNITVSENNKSFSSMNGVLFNKEFTKLVQYPIGKNDKSYTIPSTVTTIGRYSFADAFQNETNLTTITIPSGVTSIENNAFTGSYNEDEGREISAIYYGGDESQWQWLKLASEPGNYHLFDCETIHYNTMIPETPINNAPNNEPENINIRVTINGSEIEFDQPPIMQNDRTLVPLRAIFEALGATVTWDDSLQSVSASKNDIKITLNIGKKQMYINDKMIELDVPPQLIGGRTLVPVRAVSEAFGCDVKWDDSTQTVIITSV